MAHEANIQEEKKGVPWWVWLLALLALLGLALLLWWALAGDDDKDDDVAVQPTVVATAGATVTTTVTPPVTTVTPATPAATGGPITDLSVLLGATDTQLADRRVELSGVRVQSVPGDTTFWIGPTEDNQVFVVLDEVDTPDTPVEGRVDINEGQTISVSGVVKPMPVLTEGGTVFNLDAVNTQRLRDERVYIAADRAQVMSR